MNYPHYRSRRLRRTLALRNLVAETRLAPVDLVYPIFVREDIAQPTPISSMPGQNQETVESAVRLAEQVIKAGCGGVLLFGIPQHKDAQGSEAWNENGIVQTTIRKLRQEFGDALPIIADCCLDEYTDHGHCGVLSQDGSVDNDSTLQLYAKAAVSQAAAGADVIAPSGMMDGQVAAIRTALDEHGFNQMAILSYSAKYASVMYGPFRIAADCAPKEGDRRGYQMDVANVQEALREVRLDVAEGADLIMVKPALTCLDVITKIKQEIDLPVWAYNVSGEYAMITAAASNGAFDLQAAIMELLISIKRAGADTIITYHAIDAAKWLERA